MMKSVRERMNEKKELFYASQKQSVVPSVDEAKIAAMRAREKVLREEAQAYRERNLAVKDLREAKRSLLKEKYRPALEFLDRIGGGVKKASGGPSLFSQSRGGARLRKKKSYDPFNITMK